MLNTTGGKAWVKMVVPNPRNPKNRGDKASLEVLKELQKGKFTVNYETKDAYYYGEPIIANKGCLECHGTPKSDPDPHFPEYKKDGWKPGEIIGGVISRVKK